MNAINFTKKYEKLCEKKIKHIKYITIILHYKKYKKDNLEYNFEINNSMLFIYKLFGKRSIIRKFNHKTFGKNIINNEEINITLQNYYEIIIHSLKSIKSNE